MHSRRRAQSPSDVKNAAAYCARRCGESYQLMFSWSFLPGRLRWMPPSVQSVNHWQHISECQCINICGKSCERGSQLHALLIFLLERPLLFLTIHGNKHPIHTIYVFTSCSHDPMCPITACTWQSNQHTTSLVFQLPRSEIRCSLQAELTSHASRKKHSINNKKHGPNASQQSKKNQLQFIIHSCKMPHT